MTERIYTVEEIREIVVPIAKRHRVTRMYLFGSYARGDATADSDVDLRVDGEHLTTLFAWGGLYADLEQALNKSLDLITTKSLRQNLDNPLTQKLIHTMRKDEKLLYEEPHTDKQ